MSDINQSTNTFLFALQNGVIVVALFVFLLSAMICFQKAVKREFDDTFMFAASLAFTWLASFLIKIWYTIWRYQTLQGEDAQWMVGHWVISIFTLMFMAGGIMHVRALTHHIFEEKGWKIAVYLAGMVIIVAYIFCLI